ncbi:hypothetical protein [Dethiothermospora halolimnae]|uniref:hypothetical protein n=1 Tax=Dethiothermospora halolimnae TaxID=3114390 RepID=UPI003CCC11CE
MDFRCKFCGFQIVDREDRIRIKTKEDSVYIIGYCDNCLNWNILKTIPISRMKEHIKLNIEK